MLCRVQSSVGLFWSHIHSASSIEKICHCQLSLTAYHLLLLSIFVLHSVPLTVCFLNLFAHFLLNLHIILLSWAAGELHQTSPRRSQQSQKQNVGITCCWMGQKKKKKRHSAIGSNNQSLSMPSLFCTKRELLLCMSCLHVLTVNLHKSHFYLLLHNWHQTSVSGLWSYNSLIFRQIGSANSSSFIKTLPFVRQTVASGIQYEWFCALMKQICILCVKISTSVILFLSFLDEMLWSFLKEKMV